MRHFGVLLALGGCGADAVPDLPEPNVEATLLFQEITPDMLAEGSAWGGLVAAPADDLIGTVLVVATNRGDDLGGGVHVEPLPERELGTFVMPGTASFWLEPGPRTLRVSDVDLEHPGCAGGSDLQSGCFARGWTWRGTVEVPETGTLSLTIPLLPLCECYD